MEQGALLYKVHKELPTVDLKKKIAVPFIWFAFWFVFHKDFKPALTSSWRRYSRTCGKTSLGEGSILTFVSKTTFKWSLEENPAGHLILLWVSLSILLLRPRRRGRLKVTIAKVQICRQSGRFLSNTHNRVRKRTGHCKVISSSSVLKQGRDCKSPALLVALFLPKFVVCAKTACLKPSP